MRFSCWLTLSTLFAASVPELSIPSIALCVSSISLFAFSISWYSFWYAVEDLSIPLDAMLSSAFWALSTTDFWASSFAFSSSAFFCI